MWRDKIIQPSGTYSPYDINSTRSITHCIEKKPDENINFHQAKNHSKLSVTRFSTKDNHSDIRGD